MKRIGNLAGINLRYIGLGWKTALCSVTLLAAALGLEGCGQSAKYTSAVSTNDQVKNYFSGSMAARNGGFTGDRIVVDRSANTIVVSNINVTFETGTVAAASTGFANLSLNAVEEALSGGGEALTAQNPAITGTWLYEVPGVVALGELYRVGGDPSDYVPVAMASSDACPTNTEPLQFVYVTTPSPYPSWNYDARHPYTYGTVDVSAQGSTIQFNQNYYAIGASTGLAATTAPVNALSSGGCSETAYGYVIAQPINTTGENSRDYTYSSVIAKQQLLSGTAPNNTYDALGIVVPATSVSPATLAKATYRGMLYNPNNYVEFSYDHTTYPVGFGDVNGSSAACSALKALLPPSAAYLIYGGEYPTNDLSGASAENCDVAIDLGTEDSSTHGFFPNATVYLAPGSIHNSGSSLVTDLAIAVAGPVESRNMIFLTYYGGANVQSPLGVYLFQNTTN